MPEWLLKKDEYDPKEDKDSFVEKSILSLVEVLTRLNKQTRTKINRLKVNSLATLATTLIIIIFISLSRSFSFVVINAVLMMVILNLLSTKEIIYVLKVSSVVTIFTFIILVPSIFLGYGNNALLITLKVFVSVVFVNIAATTMEWNDLISALKLLFVPDIFIFVLDITLKYILILGDFSLNMVYALKLKSIGKSNNKGQSISAIVGTMFIRAKEMAEEMHGAMECRGFTGEYKLSKKVKFNPIDFICILLNIVIIALYFYFDRL